MCDLAVASPLLLPAEAAAYLRITDLRDRSDNAAVAAVNRIVDKGLLRPCIVSGRRLYARAELDRFVAEQTERYGELRG